MKHPCVALLYGISIGLETYEDQFNPDGTLPDSILQAGGFKKLRHSIGLVSTVAYHSTHQPAKR